MGIHLSKPQGVWQRTLQWLALDRLGWRLLAGGICVFFLALFLHFREVRLEVLELNTTADRYIVAQVDFEFPDYESTVVLKQQAMQDIGWIYEINPRQIREARYELENMLIHGKDWRHLAPASTFEEMYKALDELETLLLEARFSDPRTIQVVRELALPDRFFFEFIPEESSTPQKLPDDFWSKLSLQIAQSDSFHLETIDFVIKFFRAKNWELSLDEPLERTISGQVSRMVPEKFTRVVAGTRIVEPGERITSRHLTMMQAMKQAISDSRKLWEPLTLIASLLLSLIFVTTSACYFRYAQKPFLKSLQRLSLFICIVLLTLLCAKLTEYVLLKSDSSLIECVRYPIVAPFATVLICILLEPRIALFAATFLSIILSVSLAVDHSRFLILNLITSIAVIILTRNLRKRFDVFSVFAKAWIAALFVLYAYTLSENHFWSSSFFIDAIASLGFLLASAILVVGLLPALESAFGILTDMTLMEYMDPNNELLRRLAMEVPGTYQHCLVLGNLAESCASAIGANGLLCRATTLYHDIGKVLNPQFYTENQQAAINLHQLLTPLESAQVIISHVTDGELLARKAHLPQPFIDIIRQHHGTTLVYFFYRKQLELKGGHKEEVDESLFRYPGPKPQTKEAAIIMIADSVEAASRSLEDVSDQGLVALVDRLVAEKAEDHQFDECNLTFEELGRVKRALVKSLLLTHHVRVKYPKR